MRKFAIILALLLVSCSPRIIERTIYQRDTTYIEKVKVDSVYKRDSVYVMEKGDTLYIYKEKVRDKYRFIHDTAYVAKVDSVLVEREKVVEVEKPLSAWKTLQIRAFWWLCGAVLLLLLWVLRKPILKMIKL